MIRLPPGSTRTDTPFPTRRSSDLEGIPTRASVLVGTPSVAVAIHVAAADEYNQQTTAFPRVPPPRRTVPHLGFRFCPVHERPPVVFVYRVFLRVPTVGTRVLMEEAHERIHRSTQQSEIGRASCRERGWQYV